MGSVITLDNEDHPNLSHKQTTEMDNCLMLDCKIRLAEHLLYEPVTEKPHQKKLRRRSGNPNKSDAQKTKANEVGEEARETTSRIIKDSRKTSLTAIFAESQPAKPVETAKNSGVNRRCGKFVS